MSVGCPQVVPHAVNSIVQRLCTFDTMPTDKQSVVQQPMVVCLEILFFCGTGTHIPVCIKSTPSFFQEAQMDITIFHFHGHQRKQRILLLLLFYSILCIENRSKHRYFCDYPRMLNSHTKKDLSGRYTENLECVKNNLIPVLSLGPTHF